MCQLKKVLKITLTKITTTVITFHMARNCGHACALTAWTLKIFAKKMATIILEIYIGVHKKFAIYLCVIRNHKMLHKIQLALVIICIVSKNYNMMI